MRATPVSPDLKEIGVGWRETLAASAGLTLVVAVALNEQLRDFYRVPDLGEPLFSMWRLAWVAHLSLLAALRLLHTGRVRYLVLMAAALGAQWYSSMYYGVFLTIYAAVFIGVLAVARRDGWRRLALASCGLLLGTVLALPLATACKSTEAVRGRRIGDVVSLYSARPIDYLQPSTRSFWYRDVHVVKREPERELFTNVAPAALALVGIVPPFNAARLALAAAGLVAFDGSLGMNGHWYPIAYEHVGVFQSMRVPARFAILVGLSLSLLAGAGAARLLSPLKRSAVSHFALGLMTAIAVVEALPQLDLRPVWKEPPPLYWGAWWQRCGSSARVPDSSSGGHVW
jgi:hypothetical protein